MWRFRPSPELSQGMGFSILARSGCLTPGKPSLISESLCPHLQDGGHVLWMNRENSAKQWSLSKGSTYLFLFIS